MKNFSNTVTYGLVFSSILCLGVLEAAGRGIFDSSDVTPYDIYGQKLGPHTTEVKLYEYVETEEYHEVRYVSVRNGSDTKGDGTRERPWATIQHTLDNINDARRSKRYAVLVAGGGEYEETDIQMNENVDLYGGFHPQTWHRNIDANKTILNGNRQGRIFHCSDNSKIDGFAIKNAMYRGKGGAMLCDSTSPVISNNVFENNRTLRPEQWDPEFLHEIANDGGAIAAVNGASPRIINNLFVRNETEIGRGAGVAAHNHANPLIAFNTFLENRSGTDDSMMSSEGGAISAAYYSDAKIFYNAILNNKAVSTCDGGGIFSELWSSVIIAGNLIVGNYADDDGGGMYLSGQNHHYITKPDSLLPEKRYQKKVTGNILVGNENLNSGIDSGLRFTKDTRADFLRNITYSNGGGLDFHSGIFRVKGNVLFDEVTVRVKDYETNFINNLIFGRLDNQSDVNPKKNKIFSGGIPDPEFDPVFEKYFINNRLELRNEGNRTGQYTSVINIRQNNLKPGSLVNRIVKIGNTWGVIKENDEKSITIWGEYPRLEDIMIIPTFKLIQDKGFK